MFIVRFNYYDVRVDDHPEFEMNWFVLVKSEKLRLNRPIMHLVYNIYLCWLSWKARCLITLNYLILYYPSLNIWRLTLESTHTIHFYAEIQHRS